MWNYIVLIFGYFVYSFLYIFYIIPFMDYRTKRLLKDFNNEEYFTPIENTYLGKGNDIKIIFLLDFFEDVYIKFGEFSPLTGLDICSTKPLPMTKGEKNAFIIKKTILDIRENIREKHRKKLELKKDRKEILASM